MEGISEYPSAILSKDLIPQTQIFVINDLKHSLRDIYVTLTNILWSKIYATQTLNLNLKRILFLND